MRAVGLRGDDWSAQPTSCRKRRGTAQEREFEAFCFGSRTAMAEDFAPLTAVREQK